MASVNDLSANQALELSGDGIAGIFPEVKLSAKMRGIQAQNPDGSYDFGTGGYIDHELNLSSYLLNDSIVIRSQVPFLPTNGGAVNNEGDVQIQIANSFKYIATIQNESILDPDSIQNAEVTVSANCGLMDALQLYKGKVIRAPREEEGKTTFSTKAIIWDIIDTEVKLERVAGGDIAPAFYLDSSGGLTKASTIPSGKNIEFQHGITVFDENGDLRSSVSNSKSSEIQLLRVEFSENADDEFALLGKYSIKFTNATQFELTHPDNQIFTGDILTDFNSGNVAINSTYWNVIGDPTDAEIEFYCSYTVSGNPVTIVKNLLYKAFSNDWGNDPDEPASYNVDWLKFTEYEAYFNSTKVYVSETNKENSVFDPFGDSKPLRVRDFCQRILDHIGSQLTFNPEGKISMNCDWYLLPTEFVPTYQAPQLSNGNRRTAAHLLDSTGPKYNRMIVKYGLNPITNNYSGTTTFVISGDSRFNTLRVSFPYFKKSKNDNDVASLNCTLWDIAKKASTVLRATFKPNWGLPIAPGDKFEASFATQPVLPNTVTGRGRYWVIHKVTKRVGGLVDIEAHEVPAHGIPLQVCEWVLCTDSLGVTEPTTPEPNSGFTYEFPFNLA